MILDRQAINDLFDKALKRAQTERDFMLIKKCDDFVNSGFFNSNESDFEQLIFWLSEVGKDE